MTAVQLRQNARLYRARDADQRPVGVNGVLAPPVNLERRTALPHGQILGPLAAPSTGLVLVHRGEEARQLVPHGQEPSRSLGKDHREFLDGDIVDVDVPELRLLWPRWSALAFFGGLLSLLPDGELLLVSGEGLPVLPDEPLLLLVGGLHGDPERGRLLVPRARHHARPDGRVLPPVALEDELAAGAYSTT
jgi:hypothetical protein